MKLNIKFGAVALMALAAVAANAAPFTPGNIVVSRVGDGTAPLNNAAAAVFLDEYTPAGVLVQSIMLPTARVGNNRIVTNSGSATSEGWLSLSADGKYLVHVGYDAEVGTPAVVSTSVSSVNRVIARIAADGTVDSSTALTDAYDTNNVRSGTSSDGVQFWSAGTAAGTLGGVRSAQLGDLLSTLVSPSPTNTRVVRIFFGQLFVSTMSGAFRGVNTVGNGLPTGPDNATILLPGFDPSTNAPISPYEFAFSDEDTLYVASDAGAAGFGGVSKWTFNGSQWVNQYTLNAGLNVATARGLTVRKEGNDVRIFVTSGGNANNVLATTIDQGPLSAFTVIASAPADTRFRGVSLVPQGAQSPETVVPTAFVVRLGRLDQGNLASLAADDNNALRVCKFIVPNQSVDPVQVEVEGRTTVANPSSFKLGMKVRMGNTGAFRIAIELRDFLNAAWVNRAEFPVTSSYAVREVNGDGNLARYADGSGTVRMRYGIKQTGPSALSLWCNEVDFVNWTVGR
ncbi:MAG: hypothetical protein KIT11_03165 [Fimbriimonadaceae bacterium]|nr:hypothetical protein [Fimbriimonadaceae bacterium]QYK57103.1 MAG: hypothetical protein KF733_06360 [Fimbriimonadaceae bacterium]